MYQTQDVTSITTIESKSGKLFGCTSSSTSTMDFSSFFMNEIEYRDFSSSFKSFSMRMNEISEENLKSGNQKSISVRARHSDINLEEIMKRDVNISPWLRFGVIKDPWQDCQLHCLPRISSTDKNFEHNLKPEQIIANAKNLRQSPDKKCFALTKLQLNNKELEDISLLSTYRCFQYIDLSWNRLTGLEALNEMVYLMYLDASHNYLQMAICMEAPWYLTYINLSYNDISAIADLSKFWSLQHVNFSHNKIDCIQGFKSLKYLRWLDLSYNKIKILENIGYLPLIYLNLESNEISEWKETIKDYSKDRNSESAEISYWEEGESKRTNKEEHTEDNVFECDESEATAIYKEGIVLNSDIRVINLNNNLLQSMKPFEDLVLLEELNLGNNEISEFVELDYLKNKKSLKHLTLKGNQVSNINSYRILLLHYVPTIDSIDGIRVAMEEREIVYKLKNNDSAENKYELLARKLFYEQLANVECTIPGIVPMKDTCLPLIVMVGPYGSCRRELIEKLISNHDQKLYYAKNHICIPEEMINLEVFQHDKLIPRSQFNSMILSGQFLATSSFLGVEFGLSKIEYNNGVESGRMVITICDLTMAFCLQALGIDIHTILCKTINVDLANLRIEAQCKNLKQEKGITQTSILSLSYNLLMQRWPSGNFTDEKEDQGQDSSSTLNQTLSVTELSTEIESSSLSMSGQIEIEKEQSVISFIQRRVELNRELYDEIESCDRSIETVHTDNLNEAYKSLKNILRNTSFFTCTGECSLQVENLYETINNLQRKSIIEELNQRE